jgi:mannose-6-phosphate isomerase-like protein (cupin superfamily)
MSNRVQVTLWEADAPPQESELIATMAAEGLRPYCWANDPDYRYAVHQHDYSKVLYVVQGSIIFILPATGQELLLRAGDRLVLPAHTVHGALVGDEGVVCLEAPRYD